MKIEIKNIKLNITFSQETFNFIADVFVDGVKTACAENGGFGGNTCYSPYPSKRDLLIKAENYLKTLPPTYYKELDFKMDSNMEHFIDNAISVYAEEKEKAKFAKKLQKDMTKSLCYGNESAYRTCTWKNYTLEQLLNTPVGREVIKKKVAEIALKGEKVLNTNLGELI